CGPALIDGTHLCACTSTNAGTMGPGPLRVCEDSPALIPHGGDEVLDVDDVLVFVLHDGDAVTIGNILLTSPTPDFNYDPVLSYGQPYFVTAIAASNDGNGNPDPLDPCYTQSPSVEVIFDEQILASIEGDAGICLGDSTLLTFSFNGSGLYTISYSDGNQSFLLSDISNGHTVLVGPSVTTTYTLVSVAANNSVCNGIFPVNSATVAVSQIAATASVLTDFDGFGTSCNGTSDGQASVTTTAGEAPFTYLWNTGEQTATISDLVAGDYEVTVTDALGCSTVAGVSLSEPPAAVLEAVGLSPQCFGDPSGNILISQISGGTGPFEYSLNGEFFSTIDTTPYSIPLLAEGQYNLQILDANDCLVEETVVIPAPPVNIVELGDDITIDLGETVRLTPNFNFSVQAYEWDSPIEFDCGICLSPTFQPIETVRLTLTAQDEEGCIVSDDISVFVEKKRNVYFPTAFSPNGDGNNEVFFINADPSSVVSIKSFQIFSRWGALVFGRTNIQPNDPNEGWDGTVDGKLMDPAVFVYYAEIEFLDGESIFFQGDVTLLK
ncbi:MAG: gliding motility-associated C-terminal domain-containing protein, partial [Bacteroidota bacterium]